MAVETAEYLAMLRRMIRAAGKRVADADELDLGELIALQDELDRAVVLAVAGLRGRGESWGYIARGAGLKDRQAAQQRWGRHIG